MYIKGEVVWAKIKGFPWWPGVVAKIIEQKDSPDNLQEILVNFIGENSHARLSYDKVAKFNQNLNEYSKMKKKKLLDSIEIAKKIISGETTYEIESQRIENKNKNKLMILGKRKREEESLEQSDDESNKKDKATKTNKASSNNNKKDKKMLIMTPNNSIQLSKSQYHQTTLKNTSQKAKYLTNLKTNSSNQQKKISEFRPAIKKMIKLNETDQEKKPYGSEAIISTHHTSSRAHNNIDSISSNRKIDNEKKISTTSISQMNLLNRLPQRTQTQLPNTTKILSEFKSLINQIIDIIIDNESSPSHYANLDKTLRRISDPINYENMQAEEIIEKEIGKYLFTIVNLIEVLESTNEKSNHKIIISNMGEYKGQLQTILNEMKTQLINYFIEDKKYVSNYMKQVLQKQEEKDNKEKLKLEEQQKRLQNAKNKDKKDKSNMKPNEVEETKLIKDISKDSNKEGKDSKDKVYELNNRVSSTNLLAEDTKSKTVNEKDKKQNNDDEKNKEIAAKINGNGCINTINSTNSIKTIPKGSTIDALVISVKHNDNDNKSQKSDDCKDDSISNPQLRKKICLKMSKILVDKYNLELKIARDLTIKIEGKIRGLNPDMKQDYRDKILIILRLLKAIMINPDELVKDVNIDFSQLKEKLIELTKNKEQNGDKDIIFGNGLQDSPVMIPIETKGIILEQSSNIIVEEDNNKTNANLILDEI